MDDEIKRMANKWGVKWQFLKDIYFLMKNDIRFTSTRSLHGIRYAKMSRHLKNNYCVEIESYKLKYLVYLIKNRKYTK